MSDNFGVYNIKAKLETTVSSSIYEALEPPSGNINLRRKPERVKRDNSEIASAKAENYNVFVLPELSSSQHEATSLNAFFSGTSKLENTAVPASGSNFYEKSNRFVRLIYKLSASAGMPIVPGNERSPSTLENAPRSTWNTISGSYRNNSYFNPAVFSIDVPDYGKIRDVKVWVELVHDHRGGTGPVPATASNPFWADGSGSATGDLRQGLQGIQIALRSPNSNFKYSHPLWNEDSVSGFNKGPDVQNPYTKVVPELLKNSYLLWAGHSVENDLGSTLGPLTSSSPDNNSTSQVITTSTTGSFTGIGSRDIVIDRDGRIHVSFYSNFVNSLHYTTGTIDGNSWSVVRVDGSGSANFSVDNSRGSFNAIALGKNGHRHIAYSNDHSQTLVHARLTGTMGALCVTTSSVDVSHGNPSYISIGMNPLDDSPMIAVVPSPSYENAVDVYMSRSGSGGWSTENVLSAKAYRVGQVSLIVDDDATPNVFYSGLPNTGFFQNAFDIFHSRSGSNGWYETRIFSGGLLTNPAQGQSPFFIPYTGRFARDNKGNIYGALEGYFAASKNPPTINGAFGVVLAKSGSNGWTTEVAYSSSFSSFFDSAANSSGRSIFVTEDGTVHIAMLQSHNSIFNLLYLKSGSQGWSTQLVEKGSGSNGVSNAIIACDSFKDPHIVYTNNTSAFPNNLAYTRLKGKISGAAYFSFDTDIDMRTVFTDSSVNMNPRHLDFLYDSLNQGVSDFPANNLLVKGRYSSPTSGAVATFAAASDFKYLRPDEGFFVRGHIHSLTGSNFPWMYIEAGTRIPQGNFLGRDTTGVTADSSVTNAIAIPDGWLTKPGLFSPTNDVNEWPTKGYQIGPKDIKPVYPLLDDVYVEKKYDEPLSQELSLASGIPFHLSPDRKSLVGFRPGLRGTEIHGTWKLLIGNSWDTNPLSPLTSPATGTMRGGYWFRQFRVEFLVDTGQPAQHRTNPTRELKYKKSHNVSAKPGKRLIHIMSGSSAWDIGVNYVYEFKDEEYGRSVGITDSTGSQDFAVFSQITGSIVDILSGDGNIYNVRNSYLSNEFGTPYIPVTSGSGYIPSFEAFTVDESIRSRRIFSETLDPKTLIVRDNTLKAHLARSDTLKTTRDLLIQKIDLLP